MWASSSMISESGCSESSRGVRLERDADKRRLTITQGVDDADSCVHLSDQEIVTDLLATLPKLKAAVEDHENKAPNWLRKSKSGDAVEVFELLPTHDGKGDDMDIVHSVVATIEIECHLNEVLNVLTSHRTNHDLEASMRAIIPKKKVRQGQVLLQPHSTTLDGAPVRQPRCKQKTFQGGSSIRFDNTSIPENEVDDAETERKVLVSVSMTRFKSKHRIDLQGRLRNRHQRLQKLCLATLTHQFADNQRAVHVIKTLPRLVHDQLAPVEEKHQRRSVLGSGLRGLDHISVGFDIQTRTVHCVGSRGAVQSTRIIAHGYAAITPPEQFGHYQQKTMTQYSPSELANYRSSRINAEAKHVIELLTTSLQQFERVIRRRRFGLQAFIKIRPGDRDGGDRQGFESCEVCKKRFSLLRRELYCQLCGHVCCGDCSKLYEVEASVGDVTKKRMCVRCIANVDSCIFEDEEFTTALGPAVVDDDGDTYDNESDHGSDCGRNRRYENDTNASIGSTVACSEFESGGSPDDLLADLYSESALLEHSMALQALDRVVNPQAHALRKQKSLERSRMTQSQLSQSQVQLSQSQSNVKQSQASHLTRSQLNMTRFKESQLTQSQLSQSLSSMQLQQSRLTPSQLNHPRARARDQPSNSQFSHSQLSSQSRFQQSHLDDSIVAQLRANVEDHLKRTLRANLQETRLKCSGADESQFSIAPTERDYQLEFDGSQTMSPSHPLPPRPLPAQERRRLHYVIGSGALSPAYDRSALNMLAQVAATHLNCPIGYVTMIDQSTQYVVGLYPRGAIGTSIPREESMCSYTVYHERPLVVKNALNDIRFSHMGFVSQTGLRFYAGFPIRAPDSAVVATICAADYKPHKYISAKQYAEMEALADLAGTLIITPDIEIKTAKQKPQAFPRHVRNR
uniref:FYVE-type domain-containing protein n=1 Tax=Peronospora matthiolae TaxID=2874970 RepID=A0AAV1US59_9STRA